jgi:hypothetical protein
VIAPSAPIPAPTIAVANPAAEPTDAWIAAAARMLLADVDRERGEGQVASSIGTPRIGHRIIGTARKRSGCIHQVTDYG